MRIHRSSFVRWVSLATLALVLTPAFTALQISAGTVSDCQAPIADLRADTALVVLTGKQAEKNRAGLIGKLDNASAALNRGKLCDAISKLTDFRTKVNQLILSGSINNDPNAGVTGQDLVDGADAAIACIQAQVAESGVTCPLE